MAETLPAPGGKTVGATFGAGAALAYAKDFTEITLYWTGWDALPDAVQTATVSVMNAGYGALLAIFGLYLGHLWNKANQRWSNGGNAPAQITNP